MVIRKLMPILGITFIDILGFSIMIALMPFFVEHFGASPFWVGLTFTVFALCQSIAGPFWGHLSDRTGRKFVLIVSQIGAAISWIMLAFAPNLAVVFVARALEGVSGGNLSITHAYVADMVEPEKRSRAFAYVGAAFSAGMIFGPAFGGLLYAHFGYAAPFLAAAVLQILTLVLTIFYLPESRPAPGEEQPHAFAMLIPALCDKLMAPIFRQRLCYALGLYGWFSIFSLVLAAQLHMKADGVSYLFAAFGLASIVLELGLVGRIAERFGDKATAQAGLLICILTFALATFVHDLTTALVMIAVFSAGLSLCDAALPSMLSQAAPEARRGLMMSVGSALESLSGVVMPPLSTGMLQLYGVGTAAALSGGLVMLAFLFGLRIRLPQAAAATLAVVLVCVCVDRPPTALASEERIALGSVPMLAERIRSAHDVIISAYVLSPRGAVGRALQTAAEHGAHVHIVLDGVAMGSVRGSNIRAAALFRDRGIRVDLTERPLHAKVALVDGVLYLSDRNWTTKSRSELVLIDRDTRDLPLALRSVSGTTGGNDHFSTRKRDALALEATMLQASDAREFHVETEAFTSGTVVERTLSDKARAGVRVQLIVDMREYRRSPRERAALARLAESGVEIRVGRSGEKMAIAGTASWVGSANMTPGVPDQVDWGMRVPDDVTPRIERFFAANWQRANAI